MRTIFYVLLVILVALVIYGINNVIHDKPFLSDLVNNPGKKEKVINEYVQKIIELKNRRRLLETKIVDNTGKLTETQQDRLLQIDQEIKKLDSLILDLKRLKRDEDLAGGYYWAEVIYGNADKITQELSKDTLPVKVEKLR